MPRFLANLAPFQQVKILAAKQTLIQSPELLDDIVSFCLEKVGLEDIKGADLPLLDIVHSLPLLYPEEPMEPVQLPIDFGGSCHPSISNPFLLLDDTDVDTWEIFTDVRIQESRSSPIDLKIFGTLDKIQISENLLHKIVGPSQVSGMSYADRYWRVVKLPGSFPSDERKRKSRNTLDAIDLHTINGIPQPKPKFRPSFWDLLFVLLQPPLDINSDQNAVLPFPLYPYQILGVEFLYRNKSALLADDMGTGKTVMTLVALKLLFGRNEIKHALILCPPSILYEWKKHIALWTPEIIPIFVRGTQEIRKLEWNTPAHIYVTSYDTLRIDIESQLISKDKLDFYDVVVVDEAHHIKNPSTSRAVAIKKLRPNRRWALTGTPIQNKLEDMIALFDFVYPRLLNQFDSTAEQIMRKVKPYFLRRRKQDVLKDLPPKVNQDIWLEMSEDQAREYRQAERGIIQELEGMGDRITKQHIFAKIQHLKRICNFASNKNTSPKIDFIKEQIEDIVAADHKVLIFSQYIDDGVKKIDLALKTYGTAVIIGGLSDAARQVEIEKFKSGNKHPALVASVRSAGEGLNLAEASYVIHFDHWWNPAVKWQAEDRAHRKGQTNTVNVYSYWMEETIDQRIYDILKSKGLLISNVVDGMAEPKSEKDIDALFSMDDLREMIGLKKTETPVRPSIDLTRIVKMDLDEIKLFLQGCTPKEFEEIVGRLMRYLGYPNVRIVGKTGDGGIDVESTRNTGHGVEKVVAQCKRYQKPVGVQIARDFFGAISDNTTIMKGFLITTSEFSAECITFCLRNDIYTVDGLRMAEYVKQFGLAEA